MLLRAIDAVWPPHESKDCFVKGLLARLFVEEDFPQDNLVFQADMVKLGRLNKYGRYNHGESWCAG